MPSTKIKNFLLSTFTPLYAFKFFALLPSCSCSQSRHYFFSFSTKNRRTCKAISVCTKSKVTSVQFINQVSACGQCFYRLSCNRSYWTICMLCDISVSHSGTAEYSSSLAYDAVSFREFLYLRFERSKEDFHRPVPAVRRYRPYNLLDTRWRSLTFWSRNYFLILAHLYTKCE
jgi:hypothetical protein